MEKGAGEFSFARPVELAAKVPFLLHAEAPDACKANLRMQAKKSRMLRPVPNVMYSRSKCGPHQCSRKDRKQKCKNGKLLYPDGVRQISSIALWGFSIFYGEYFKSAFIAKDSRGEEPPRVGVGSPKNPFVYSGFGMVIPNHLKQVQRESVKIVVSLLWKFDFHTGTKTWKTQQDRMDCRRIDYFFPNLFLILF